LPGKLDFKLLFNFFEACNRKIGVGSADGEPEFYFFDKYNFIEV